MTGRKQRLSLMTARKWILPTASELGRELPNSGENCDTLISVRQDLEENPDTLDLYF